MPSRIEVPSTMQSALLAQCLGATVITNILGLCNIRGVDPMTRELKCPEVMMVLVFSSFYTVLGDKSSQDKSSVYLQ